MVDERGDESAAAAQHRSPPPDDDVDLGETNLFDEPEALQPMHGLTAASDEVRADAEPLESRLEAGGGPAEHDDTGIAAGPLDMTSHLVSTVLALAEGEQAVGRSGVQEDSVSVQGDEVAAAGAPSEGGGRSYEEANNDRGDELLRPQAGVERLARPGTDWVLVDDSSQRAELETGGTTGAPAALQNDVLEQVSWSEEEPSVALGEGQPDGAREGGLVATTGNQGSGHEVCADCEVEQQDGGAGSLNDALDHGESSGTALDVGGHQLRAGQEECQPSVDEAGMMTDPCTQAAAGPWSDAGRRRGFTEEWCAAQEHQQRASCEPGLRRSDSYHQLMMASA